MTTETLVHIRWNGKESVTEALQFIQEQHNIEIELPANFHNACFRRLYPNATPGTPDFIDVENGDRLIEKIASVDGLNDLKALVTPITRSGAKVMMKSPTPRIYIGYENHKKRFNYF